MKMIRSRGTGLLRSNRGSTSVIILCTTIALILFSAVVADIGYAAYAKVRLTANARKVAHLGAEALAENRSDAVELMKKAAVRNMDDLNNLDIRVSDNNRCITIVMGKPIHYMFLKLLGTPGKQISTTITAQISNASSYKGVRPFIIERGRLVFEKTLVLTSKPEGGAGELPFAAMSLGKDDLKTSIVFGYRNQLTIGDGIHAGKEHYPEVMQEALGKLQEEKSKEPAERNLRYNDVNKRILVLPVVETLQLSAKEPMKLAGFAVFYLQSWERKEGTIHLKGRFIRYSTDAGTSDSAPFFGLTGVRMYH